MRKVGKSTRISHRKTLVTTIVKRALKPPENAEIVRMLRRNQVTLPAELCERLGIHERAVLQAYVVEGRIVLDPSVVVSRTKVEELVEGAGEESAS